MQTSIIYVTQASSTGFNADWEQISKIEVISPPFEGGAFGDIYDCLAINDKGPNVPLAVKILKPDSDDNYLGGYETIRKLQARIRAKGQELHTINGLYALPQFSFMGRLQNRIVFGYAANKLDANRFSTLEEILQNRFREFRKLSFGKKIRMALDLTVCFERLRDLNYIHADINPLNLFVNLYDTSRASEKHLVVIDYDGGVVVDNPIDTPATFGKKNEWLAPEVYEQESRMESSASGVTVDLSTDAWAVAVGVHYLLLSRFPFFFLKVAGPQELREYLAKYRWPHVDKTYANFNPTQARVYDDFRRRFRRIDSDLKRPLILTFNEGVYNPSQRVSYSQWTLSLRRVLGRRRSIKNGLFFILLLLIVVVPFFHEPVHIAMPHTSVAEADAGYADFNIELATKALTRGDRSAAERALALAANWDAARVAQFRRTHAAALSTNSLTKNQNSPAREAIPTNAATARSEVSPAQKTSPVNIPPRPGDLRRDELSGMEFVFLKGGCFNMGSATTELGRKSDEGLWGRHYVCLDGGFWLATTEVTNAQYQRIFPGHNSGSPGSSLDDANQPVVNVSWLDAAQFLLVLNQRARDLGLAQHYRLPSEAQWEYAARAGISQSHFWGGDSEPGCRYANMAISPAVADPRKNKGGLRKKTNNTAGCTQKYAMTAPVGSFEPNPWGLYDMLGNVSEWTCSAYQESYDGTEKTCASLSSPDRRVLRGESWHDLLSTSRVALREADLPDAKNSYRGFRIMLEY